MSLSPNEKYPGATEADPNYKDSKFKDNNPSTTNNGSPLKALDRNEQLALQEAMMNAAGFDYNGVVDTPQNSQMFNAYKAALSNGANLISNHNFLTSSPDTTGPSATQPPPSATPTSYPPGFQIFSGVFANETTGILNLTYIDGRVSFSGGDFYMSVPNTGALENITDFVASVADFDGKPRTRGVSYALVGDEYRVTVGVDALEDESANETLLGSVKFEQGSVATGHEVGSLSTGSLSDYTDIAYKASGGNSAVENMIAGASVESSVGDNCKTGGTTWKRISDSFGDIRDFKPLTDAYLDDWGLAGDGFTDDWALFLKAASDCALSQASKMKGTKGKDYFLNNLSGQFAVFTFEWDGGGCTLSPQNPEIPFIEVQYSADKAPQAIPVSDIAKIQNDWEGSIILGWDNNSPVTNSYFSARTDTLLCAREGFTGQDENYFENGVILADGNVIGEKICGLVGNVIESSYKPLEDSRLMFGNFTLNCPDAFRYPRINVTRNQVTAYDIRLKRENIEPVNYFGEIFYVNDVYSFKMVDAQSDATGRGYGKPGAGTAGYLVYFDQVVGIDLRDCTGLGYWGCFNGYWIKELTVKDSDLNRIDSHFGLGNCYIENVNLYGWGISLSYGKGDFTAKNCKLYMQRTTGEDSSLDIFEQTSIVNLNRNEYGMGYQGDILTENCGIIWDSRNDSGGSGARNLMSVVGFEKLGEPSYNNVDSNFVLPKSIKIRDAFMRVGNKSSFTSADTFRFIGVYIDTQNTSKLYELPDVIDIQSSTVRDYGYATFQPVYFNGPVNNSESGGNLFSKYCEFNIENIRNASFPVDWDSFPDEANTTNRINLLKDIVLVYWGGPFGFTQTGEAAVDFEINITNSDGWFYNSSYTGDFRAVGCKLVQPRTNDMSGVTKKSTQKVSECEILPFPNEGGVDPDILVCQGGIMFNDNIIQSITIDGGSPATQIITFNYLYGGRNVIAANSGFNQSSVDLVWSPRFTNANNYKIPTL